MVFFIRPIFKILCMVAFLCSFEAMATDDDYLKMLEGEAEDVKLDQSGQIKDKEVVSTDSSVITKTNWEWDGDLEGNALPKGLSQDEFAAIIKQNFYGTYVFYRKLNSVDQLSVFQYYAKTSPDLDSIRQNILNQLKK